MVKPDIPNNAIRRIRSTGISLEEEGLPVIVTSERTR